MKVRVIFFAQLESMAGTKELLLENIKDTNSLQERLEQIYPEMIGKPYVIAVNKDIVNDNTTLSDGNNVAFLPPFSGG